MTISEVSVIRHRKLSVNDIDDHIDYKFYRNEDKVKWARTRSPDVRIGTLVSKFEVTIVIELNGKVEGVVTLEPPRWSLGVTGVARDVPRLFTPHTSFLRPLQGLGYASAIYTAYLNKGASFVTDEQTEGATRLWDKLTSQGFKTVYVERYALKGGGWANRLVPDNSSTRLTVRCLLGKGAKPENLFYLEDIK
jgi:hypothetical protein